MIMTVTGRKTSRPKSFQKFICNFYWSLNISVTKQYYCIVILREQQTQIIGKLLQQHAIHERHFLAFHNSELDAFSASPVLVALVRNLGLIEGEVMVFVLQSCDVYTKTVDSIITCIAVTFLHF